MAKRILAGLLVVLAPVCLGARFCCCQESTEIDRLKLLIERRGGRLKCPRNTDAVSDSRVCGSVAKEGCTVQFINCDDLSGEDISLLARVRDLKHLDLRLSRVQADVLWAVTRLSNIEDLDLSSTLIDDASLQILAAAPNLKLLKLNYTNVTPEGLKRLSIVCKDLSFDLAPTRPDDALQLGTLKLNLLDLSNLNLSDSKLALRCLQSLPQNIGFLSLARTDIDDSGLKGMSNLTGLKGLDLSGNPITDRGLNYLSTLQSLEQLGVGNDGQDHAITDDSFLWQLGGLRGCRSLRTVDLSGSKVSDKGLQYLVSHNPLLEQLFLKNSYVTGAINWVDEVNKTATTPSGAAESAGQLCSLDFTGTLIDEHGLAKVAKVTSLKVLNLSSTDLTNKKILDGLKSAEGFAPTILLTGSKATPIVVLELKAEIDKIELAQKAKEKKATEEAQRKQLQTIVGLTAASAPVLDLSAVNIGRSATHLRLLASRPIAAAPAIPPTRPARISFAPSPGKGWSLQPSLR